MKKSEIAKGLDIKATSFLFVCAVIFAVNSVISNITAVTDMPTVIKNVCMAIGSILSVVGYFYIIKGFVTVNKACKISEKNENFYMGRNLTALSVFCIVFSIIITVVALALSVIVAQYGAEEVLTPADEQARYNLLVLVALCNIVTIIISVSTPFIFYLWKIYKLTSVDDKISKFALLGVIVIVVYLVISILNIIYSVNNNTNEFLPTFTRILNTIKYVVLVVFFAVRKQKLINTVSE